MKRTATCAASNAAAGVQPVQVSEATAALLAQAKALAQTTDGAFALTVAPITLAWGVHSDSPRVVPPEECAALAALASTLFVPPSAAYIFLFSTSACCACFSA